MRVVAPGERLPPERELASILNVSPVTLRHALRDLAGEGLLELRRGRLGGAHVRGVPALGHRPDRIAPLRAAADAVRHALDFRRVIEPEAAAVAATAPGPRGVASIVAARDLVARCAGGPDSAFMAADTAFHLAIATVSGNPLLLSATQRIQTELAPALQALPETGAWHDRSVTEHAVIAAHVAEGDGDGARAAMLAHLQGTDRATRLLLDGLPRRVRAPRAATAR